VTWALFASVLAPAGIVVHELGHFIVSKAFGFPNVVLHFGSVSSDAAVGFPSWQRALSNGAGPAVTLLIVLGCCLAARLFGPHPFTIGFGLTAGFRSGLIGITYFVVRLGNPVPNGSIDELNFARRLDLPPDLVMGVSTLVVLMGWAYLIRSIPKGARVQALTGITLGIAAGLGIYISWIGPALLP
jgi:hypothetical protein